MEGETFLYINGIIKLRALFLLLFISEILIYIIISAIPYNNPALVSQLKAEENATYSNGIVGILFSIFPHNLFIATIEFIPAIGQLFYVLSMVETPLALSALANSTGVPGFIDFIILLIVPDTLIELPSYAIAAATGIYLIYILVKSGEVLRSKIRKVLYMYLFVALELFIAGTFESLAIEMGLTLPKGVSLTYTFLLWIPAIPSIYLLIRLFRRINRDEYGKNVEVIPETFELQ